MKCDTFKIQQTQYQKEDIHTAYLLSAPFELTWVKWYFFAPMFLLLLPMTVTVKSK